MSETTEKAPESQPAAEKKCRKEGCKRPYRAKNYCVSHYQMWRRGEMDGHKGRYKICAKEACKKIAGRWGFCDEHRKKSEAGAAAAT